MFETKEQLHVANCPKCDTPHRYTELKFPVINDMGNWLVACRKCQQNFTIRLRNPEESYSSECKIMGRFDDDCDPYQGNAPPPGESAVYNLEMNPDLLHFESSAFSIYRCDAGGGNLEVAAYGALNSEWRYIKEQWSIASNYMLSGRLPDIEHVVVLVGIKCSCGSPHKAVFYQRWLLDGSQLPDFNEMLLADVSGSDIQDLLTGILSKTELMQALEKLIVRWRLFFDQVLLATPFVAHQWKTKAERLAIWEQLLNQLDTTRTVLLTRGKTYKEYSAALLEAGLDHDVLSRFGLENRIVGDGARKQDFHAKVYIGLGEHCEVLSGSANVVRGDSKENATFQTLSRSKVEESYIKPLGVDLPSPRPRFRYHLLMDQNDGHWKWDVVEGAAPELRTRKQ
jgi:hypothetical protein